jgi:hypothetical protein
MVFFNLMNILIDSFIKKHPCIPRINHYGVGMLPFKTHMCSTW